MKNLFIETYQIDPDLCDTLRKTFLAHPRLDESKKPMNFVNGKVVEASPSVKQSTDLSFTLDDSLEYPIFAEYVDALQVCINRYIERYPACNMYAPWKITRPINLQWYKPGEGYHEWHAERCSGNPITVTRHLVFMTYLNTVTDLGGTEWYDQELLINAEIGKTVIWPADWTFTHRGISSPTQHKFIATGWYNFIEEQ
jgi:prolyl 4-hydroxylase